MARRLVLLSYLLPAVYALFLLHGCAGGPRRNLAGVNDIQAGFDRGTFARLDGLLWQQERSGEILQGVLVVKRWGRTVYTNYFSSLGKEKGAGPAGPEMLFDTASLAKPLAGVPAAVLLSRSHPDEQWILEVLDHSPSLDDEVWHSSLLKNDAWNDAWEELSGLPSQPCYRYSNSTYAVLGKRFAAAYPEAEKALRREVWAPMGLETLAFVPEEKKTTAATGYTEAGDLLRGEPYDPLAGFMLSQQSGLPLHSGLFASAGDIAEFGSRLCKPNPDGRLRRIAELLLGKPEKLSICGENGSVYISPGGMLSPVDPPFAAPGSEPGRYFYQTGYTGCLLWIDRESWTSVALLTNASVSGSRQAWDEFSKEVIQLIVRGMAR